MTRFNTPILDTISPPSHQLGLDRNLISKSAKDLRDGMIGAISDIDGHFGATHAVDTAAAYDVDPSPFDRPRGTGFGVERSHQGLPFEIGKGRVLVQNAKVAILPWGGRLYMALQAVKKLTATK